MLVPGRWDQLSPQQPRWPVLGQVTEVRNAKTCQAPCMLVCPRPADEGPDLSAASVPGDSSLTVAGPQHTCDSEVF